MYEPVAVGVDIQCHAPIQGRVVHVAVDEVVLNRKDWRQVGKFIPDRPVCYDLDIFAAFCNAKWKFYYAFLFQAPNLCSVPHLYDGKDCKDYQVDWHPAIHPKIHVGPAAK